MASVEIEMAEVLLQTYPDELPEFFDHGHVLSYQRIAELYLDDGHLGQSAKLPYIAKTKPTTERQLKLPLPLAKRLMEVVTDMHDYGNYNCHRFSRAMKSADLARGHKGREPITQFFRERPRVDNLPIGAIGLVGVSGHGVPHSLVGLGVEVPESLQVMSARGQLGIAANTDVLDWYRWINDGEEVHLYQAPETLSPALRRT